MRSSETLSSVCFSPPRLPPLTEYGLLCDGGYLSHYAQYCDWLQAFRPNSRLPALMVWLAKQAGNYRLWAWDSPYESIHDKLQPLLSALGFDAHQRPGLSADSILASAIAKAPKPGVLVTHDKDIHAFSTLNISALSHSSGWTLLTAHAIAKAWGVSDPMLILDVLAWSGDKADGIPGIPGVDIATAQRLVNQCGSVFDVINRVDAGEEAPAEITPYLKYLETLRINYMKISPSPSLNLLLTRIEPNPGQVPELLYHLEVEPEIIRFASVMAS